MQLQTTKAPVNRQDGQFQRLLIIKIKALESNKIILS